MRWLLAPVLTAACLFAGRAPAAVETAPFDLAGPALRVSVTHQGKTLPIAEVPQLATGDDVSVVPDFPKDQSAKYVLVAAFLRGSTNPPPDRWFFQARSWTNQGRKGLSLAVPEGAQQLVLFLAPATGGDFATLRNAVRGRPGAFVRAGQELAQASLDHARLDSYLAAVRKTVPGDPARLKRITPLLARSLQVKINPECLTKLPELEAACLLQNQASLVLNDGHSDMLTSAVEGPGADLALQISATPEAGFGFYSPYIAAVRDVIGIFSSLHTARYQYIPALATLDGDRMALVLNTPPSFHNPKSVLVSALPIVAPVHIPPLQTIEAEPVLCAAAPEPLLPMVGAPLVYATRYAHDLVLRARLPDGSSLDLPATPDAERGGLIVQTGGRLADLRLPIEAALHGDWGFQPFDGPTVRLQPAEADRWRLPQGAARAQTVTLAGGTAACVTGVTARGEPVPWRETGSDAITVTLPPALDKKEVRLDIAGPSGIAAAQVTLAAAPSPIRFAATLIAHNVQRPAAPGLAPISLDGSDAVPADAALTFSLRAGPGMRFNGHETLELSAEDGGGAATLGPDGGLTIADPQVAIATVLPEKALGSSAFGPLRVRVVRDGAPGDWVSIGTLIRLPRLHPVKCPAESHNACLLTGSGLFLIDAISPTADFADPITVPEGFTGNSIQIPRPAGGVVYLRFHDDPQLVGRVTA